MDAWSSGTSPPYSDGAGDDDMGETVEGIGPELTVDGGREEATVCGMLEGGNIEVGGVGGARSAE
eukprot:scaffold132201_cov29-Tisochrysis_lutea.AAC.1